MFWDASETVWKEYQGIVWIGDEPGLRFTLWAPEGLALAAAKAEFGDYPMTLHNEVDSHKLRE